MKSALQLNQPVPEKAIQAAYKWAEKNWPNEAVGQILNNKTFKPLTNIHSEPEKHFEIDPKTIDWLNVTHLIHNHPDGILAPSKGDMECYADIRIPMGIFVSVQSKHEISHTKPVWYNPKDHSTPYEGRTFVNGIWDCYSIIRDFYWHEYGIEMGDYARDDAWFDNNPKLNLYERNFKKEGFKSIPMDNIERGDIILMKFYLGKATGPVNHGAIYLGNDKILHHYAGRLSSIDNAARWITRYGVKAIRRKNK